MALLKSRDVYIDPSSPWANDPFERRAHGDRLLALIRTLREQPYVIALNGDWGSGKSVFLQRLEAHFEGGTPKVPFIRIDAWAADDSADPLLPFTAAIHHRLAEVKGKAQRVRMALTDAAEKLAVPATGYLATLVAPGSGSAVTAAAKFGTSLIEWELSRQSATGSFKRALEEARDLLTDRKGGGPIRTPVVIAIDELDRCRPDFSIRALERIKHFFNIAGVVFVIATDRGNLPSAVHTVYGPSIDGELYLRKFFDFEYRLRPPKASANFTVLWQDYGLEATHPLPEEDETLLDAFRTGDRYPELLRCSLPAIDAYEYRWYFVHFADLFRLSLRDQTQAFTMLAAHILTTPPQMVRIPILDCLLACLRFFSPQAFDDFVSNHRTFTNLGTEYPERVRGALHRVGSMGEYKALNMYLQVDDLRSAEENIHQLINASISRMTTDDTGAWGNILARIQASNTPSREYVKQFLELSYAFT